MKYLLTLLLVMALFLTTITAAPSRPNILLILADDLGQGDLSCNNPDSKIPTPHLELARSLGADRVVDYTAEDFTQIDDTFDFVLDAVGKTSYFQCRPLLKPRGVFAATDLGRCWQNVFLATAFSLTGSGRVVFPIPHTDPVFIEFLRDQIQTGAFNAVVDRTYLLQDIAAAYRYVDTEQKVGCVVIEVVADDS